LLLFCWWCFAHWCIIFNYWNWTSKWIYWNKCSIIWTMLPFCTYSFDHCWKRMEFYSKSLEPMCKSFHSLLQQKQHNSRQILILVKWSFCICLFKIKLWIIFIHDHNPIMPWSHLIIAGVGYESKTCFFLCSQYSLIASTFNNGDTLSTFFSQTRNWMKQVQWKIKSFFDTYDTQYDSCVSKDTSKMVSH